MADLTFASLELSETNVKPLLDEASEKFLKTDTINLALQKGYDLVAYYIDITETNKVNVKNAIIDIAVWRCFVIYGQSVSQHLQFDDLEAYRVNVENYKEFAKQSCALLNIDLDRKPAEILSDPIPYVNHGGSLIDVDEDSV